MADFGSDFHLVDDLDPQLSTVSGPMVVVEAVVRRLQTPRGGLWYDPAYGTDLRQYLNGVVPRFRVASDVEEEARKDERVQAARATVTFSGETMTVVLTLELADGPFALTIGVDALTVKLIDFSQAS